MDLKAIWKRSISMLTYPKDIIPQLNYKEKIDFTELLKDKQIYLLRRSQYSSFEKTFREGPPGKYELNEDALVGKPDGVNNLSTNIFGHFKEHYLKFRLTNKSYGGSPWEKKEVNFYENISSISSPIDGIPIYIDANKIHNKPQRYDRPTQNDELQKFIKTSGLNPIMVKSGKPNEYSYDGMTKIEHDPLNFNYWHAVYDFYDFKGDKIKNLGSKWGITFCKDVISNTISNFSYPNPPKQVLGLEHNDYIENPAN